MQRRIAHNGYKIETLQWNNRNLHMTYSTV